MYFFLFGFALIIFLSGHINKARANFLCFDQAMTSVTITQFPADQKSFLMEQILPPGLKRIANRIPHTLISNSVNTEFGLLTAYDKPLGSSQYISNFKRPAVLRQYFGQRAITRDKNSVYCYGTGSGSSTVGTHPRHQVTREQTIEMQTISQYIYRSLLNLQSKQAVPKIPILEPFNHCTVLLYFQKHNRSGTKLLGFHTDNVYSVNGEFLTKQNSQKEDTPTCVLTLGSKRQLIFQQQFHFINRNTRKRKWSEVHRREINLSDNSLFILHPDDERPLHLGNQLKSRWRHGVPHFKEKNALSIALVFRTVVNTADITQAPMTLDKEDMKLVEVVHSRLKSLFKLKT